VNVLARQGNRAAQRFWDELGGHLGFVLAGIVNLVNPSLIVIGGGVANNFPLFSPSLKRTLKDHCIVTAGRRLKIVRAKLGDDAGIIGASFLVRQRQKAAVR
jgi:glucokinase